VNKQTPNKPPQNNNRRKRKVFKKNDEKIYFEGVVVDTLPGVRFKVKIDRKTLEPLMLECMLKSLLKVKKVKIIRGDFVTIEIDPTDLSKGVIVSRN
jgi:translation initiation factor IF-1